jgi:hypothetical protein
MTNTAKQSMSHRLKVEIERGRVVGPRPGASESHHPPGAQGAILKLAISAGSLQIGCEEHNT